MCAWAGMTQEQLAFESRIDLTYMGGIERGRRNPSLLVMSRVAQAPGVGPAELLRKQYLAKSSGSAGRIRTYDQPVNSRLLYH